MYQLTHESNEVFFVEDGSEDSTGAIFRGGLGVYDRLYKRDGHRLDYLLWYFKEIVVGRPSRCESIGEED